jgi:hypothetical protein
MRSSIWVAALPLLAAGCAPTLPDVLGDKPDSFAGSPVRYENPISLYTHRTPVGPKTWRVLNDAQAPKRGGKP